MAINPRNRGPLRILAALIVIIFGVYGLLAAVNIWGDAQRTPKLGLDLEGGTQLILQPKIVGNQKPSEGQTLKAVDIIRNRVNGSGVSEAEVTTQAGNNIVVSLPGSIEGNRATIASLQKSSQLRIRPVLVLGSAAPTPVPTATGKPTAPAIGKTPTPPAIGKTPTAPATSKPTAQPKGTATTAPKSGFPPALAEAATPTPTPSATKPGAAANPTGGPAAKPKDPSDLAWVTPDVEAAFTALDCNNPREVQAIVDDPDKPMVTCSDDGAAKYILGPTEVLGSDISNATSGLQPQSSVYEVRLDLNSAGRKAFCTQTSRIVSLPAPRNRSAVILDNQVITDPVPQVALCSGNASITGGFTAASAKVLADQLKFGALPMSFDVQTQNTITPQVGGDQLRRGLLAGAIGLLLVVAYSLFQYRALGLVTVSSLLIASALTYGAVTLFGWSYGFRLTMAGVAGLIVSIGITADSFIIYFERVRDEVRSGRALPAAVETGWTRALRTILISDGVNFLAAAVLYALAASNVQGFAFTLMLTTIIDLVVVMLFTHPLLSILANTEFFGKGHKWSGLDPKRLGTKTATYAGRGRVTIAAQHAAEGSPS